MKREEEMAYSKKAVPCSTQAVTLHRCVNPMGNPAHFLVRAGCSAGLRKIFEPLLCLFSASVTPVTATSTNSIHLRTAQKSSITQISSKDTARWQSLGFKPPAGGVASTSFPPVPASPTSISIRLRRYFSLSTAQERESLLLGIRNCASVHLKRPHVA